MNKQSQKQEPNVGVWFSHNLIEEMVEVSINVFRSSVPNPTVVIFDSKGGVIDRDLIAKINPNFYETDSNPGIHEPKGWVAIRNLLVRLKNTCERFEVSGVFRINDFSVCKDVSWVDKNAGLCGHRNGMYPVVHSSMYWISLDCINDCISFIDNGPVDKNSTVPETVAITSIAYAKGHYVKLYNKEHLSVFSEIDNRTTNSVTDFRKAFSVYTSLKVKIKMIIDTVKDLFT